MPYGRGFPFESLLIHKPAEDIETIVFFPLSIAAFAPLLTAYRCHFIVVHIKVDPFEMRF